MLPITILQYFFNANQILAERLSESTDLVNNIAYSFVALIPFVFLFKQKKIFAIASMMILMFFIIQGGKRGALIAGTIGLLFFIYYSLKTVEKKYRYRSFIFVFIGVFGLSYFVYNVFQNNDFDIRIVVVGNKAAGEKRFVRKNDFRASGSGEFSYEGIEIDVVEMAFDVSKRLGLQSAAFDFIYDINKKPLIVEVSYGFGTEGISKVYGYWDNNLNWHNEEFRPSELILKYFLSNSSI